MRPVPRALLLTLLLWGLAKAADETVAGDTSNQLDDFLSGLCVTNPDTLPANMTDPNAGVVAAGTSGDILSVAQTFLCEGGAPKAGLNISSVVGSLDELLSGVNSTWWSTLVQQLVTNPQQGLGAVADLLATVSPTLASLLPEPSNSTLAASPSPAKPLDVAALQPILTAILASPTASQQLPALLPLFQALTSGNTSALGSLDWNALGPVLQVVLADPAARAALPALLPAITQALGGAVSNATGSQALGDLVTGVSGGIASIVQPILQLIFGAPATGAPAATPPVIDQRSGN